MKSKFNIKEHCAELNEIMDKLNCQTSPTIREELREEYSVLLWHGQFLTGRRGNKGHPKYDGDTA